MAGVFLVFGFRVLWRTIAVGRFVCPHEGTEQACRHQSGRRWFTVFFVVPVIPMGAVGESVQCTSCRRRFAVDALNRSASGPAPAPAGTGTGTAAGPAVGGAAGAVPAFDPQVALALGSHALRVAAAGLLRAEGAPSASARATAVKAIRANQSAPYDDAALETDLADVNTPPEDLLWPLAAHLDARGKERFLESCLEVLGKPALLTANQRAGMDRLGRALGLTEANVAGVIALVQSQTR